MVYARSFIARARDILKTPHGFYLVTALIACTAVAIITPPFLAADEPAHYTRVQELAHGIMRPAAVGNVITKPAEARFYCNLDTDIKKIALDHDIKGYTNQKYNTHLTIGGIRDEAPCPSSTTSYTVADNSTGYGVFVYIPAVVGAFIANHIGLSLVSALYVSRIFTLVSVIMIIYAAVKIMPTKKMLFAGVALLPSVVFLGATISADSISLAILFLFIAYVSKLFTTKNEILRKQWVVLGVISLLLALTKTPYYIFIALNLLLIKKSNIKQIVVPIIITIGSFLIAILSMYIISASAANSSTAGVPDGVNSPAQVHIIEHKPLRFARVLWNTYTSPYGDIATNGIIGVLGWGDVYLPAWLMFYYVIILVLLVLPLEDSKKNAPWKLSRLQQGLIALLIIGNLLAANLAMYLYYSPVNYNIVYGIQGRYFLPSLIAGLLLVCGWGVRFVPRDLEKYSRLLKILLCFGLAVTLILLYQRYYLFTP